MLQAKPLWGDYANRSLRRDTVWLEPVYDVNHRGPSMSFSQRPRSCLRWRHPRAEHMDTPSIATAAVSDRQRTGLEDDTATSKAPIVRDQQTTHARLPCGLSIRHSQLLVHDLRSKRFEDDKSNNSQRSTVNKGAETIRHHWRRQSCKTARTTISCGLSNFDLLLTAPPCAKQVF